jgi:excinuclease ABC subunit C
LDTIKGIGPKAREALLNALKSVKKISEATLEQLTEAVGPAKAAIVYNHFHPQDVASE